MGSSPGQNRCAAAALTSGEYFDVVFDATGNPQSMQKGFDFVAHGGRYVLVSVVKSAITFEDADFHRKEMTLLGSRNATSVDFDRVVAAIREGRVPLDKIITHRTTLAGAARDLPIWATTKTGLKHGNGTISMGRHAPGTANADFFITLGDQSYLDADPKDPKKTPGFAAFGQVVEGLDVVQKIIGLPVDPNAGVGAMKGEMLKVPVRISRISRYVEPKPAPAAAPLPAPTPAAGDAPR